MERLSKVGFIGLGNIGRPMAVCLLKAGFTLTVLDVTPKVQQAFVDFHGAHSASSLSELGSSSDAVITMVPNGHEVSRVVLGVEGDDHDCLLGSMQKGPILVDMSSSSPTGTQALGKTLADHGKSLAVRTECIGTCGKTFQAVGVAIPATIRELCNMSKSSVICSAK